MLFCTITWTRRCARVEAEVQAYSAPSSEDGDGAPS